MRIRIRSTWLAIALATAALTILSVPGAAVAAPTLDQQQTLDLRSPFLIGSQIPAQVVTAGIAGLLTQVELPLRCPDRAYVVNIEIREATDRPLSRVLASQTITGVGDELTWRSVQFPTPPFFPADGPFAIVLSTQQGSCNVFGSNVGANPYPNGNGWYQGPPNPPDVWSPGGADLGFKTFVERTCQVPDLIDLSEQEARALLTQYGCATGRVTRAPSSSVAKGNVISQRQPEGMQLPSGGAVDFIVSLGPASCKVPKLYGKRLADARSAVARANCRVGTITTAPSPQALRGRVIRQRPPAGVTRPYGTRVNLVVGHGSRPSPQP